jgi:hypothetical protein
MPLSEQDRWDESLLITDLDVVRDPNRTWTSCGPGAGGNPHGVWTFFHLMNEMAAGAVPAMTVEEFTVAWLETWLNDQPVNSDLILARTTMFNCVIKPWADKSGVTATLNFDKFGNAILKVDGPLSWKWSPFRLAAIVNCIDLGKDAKGGGGYGGGPVSVPQTAGELRFVFGVLDLDNAPNCNAMRFSVIFEYGVPLEGCKAVKDWAIAWTQLNDPGFAIRFTAAWRNHLEKLTESVVLFGAAPSKGNKNAINQIRTNENALHPQWEFREFTLTKEDPDAPPGTPDTPVDGPLRTHTVAMTIDDTVFSEFSDPFVTGYVMTDVVPTVPPIGMLPNDCRSDYEVPHKHLAKPFRGGNSFTAAVTHWEVNINPFDLEELCGRHEFSLNNCNGCHFSDTATPFFHVDPTFLPAPLSNFLTGAGGIWSVPDPQFPGFVTWTFADLDRRFNRLYEIACAECGDKIGIDPGFSDVVVESTGVFPGEPPDDDTPVGPITDPKDVAKILDARVEFAVDTVDDVQLSAFGRQRENFVH